MIKISVVMPAYNAEKYIGQAIESILNQTYSNFEFIIINDGSNDKTKEVILSYKDDRIIYLENERNSGIVVTLNKGLEKANGEYIARMDADDIAEPNRFEKQIKYLDKNIEIDVLGSGICTFGENIKSKKRLFTTNADQLKAELIFSSCIAHPTVMIRKNILEKYNLKYDLNFAGAEDYCLWWEIAKVSKIATLPDILLNYRMHESQVTKVKDSKYYNMMKALMDNRFKDINFDATKEEKTVFMNYCLGRYSIFTQDNIHEFIRCLNNILKNNKNNNYFNQNKLQKIFELAILYVINNSNLSNIQKKQCYKYAVSRGIFTLLTRIKVKYHKMYV